MKASDGLFVDLRDQYNRLPSRVTNSDEEVAFVLTVLKLARVFAKRATSCRCGAGGCRCPAKADDAAVEATLKVIKHIRAGKSIKAPVAFVRLVVKRTITDMWRTGGAHKEISIEETAENELKVEATESRRSEIEERIADWRKGASFSSPHIDLFLESKSEGKSIRSLLGKYGLKRSTAFKEMKKIARSLRAALAEFS